MIRRRWLARIVGGAAVMLLLLAFHAYNAADVGSEAIRFHLRLVGASIYEYHAKTGKWPTRTEDLAVTSLVRKSPHWRTLFQNESIVVAWPRQLKAEPADNTGRILAYHNKGLLASFGRVWVCRGDLETEYLPTETVRALVRNGQD